MDYCNIERTRYCYDSIFGAMKLIQLENDANYGDVFDNYILCCEGNSPMFEEWGEWDKFTGFKKGDYVHLIPLNLIDHLVSNRNDLLIDGFYMWTEPKTYYRLLGFESDGETLGAEILDKDLSKAISKTYYHYIRR